jgi:uncharacterized membrane protein (TIGR02234 family)
MAERPRRRLFWPVVLLGVAGAVVAAIAGDHQWKSLGLPKGAVFGASSPQLDSPATTALALVALAAWGVFLVTRRWVRRVLAVLAALASLGALITSFSRPDAADVGFSSYTPIDGSGHVTTTVWPWVALVGALVSLAAAVLAFLEAPAWPEMGRRYDAPTASKAGVVDLEGAESIELWKTISEGHDPTSDRE